MTYPCSRPLTVATASVTLSSMPTYIGSFFNANLIKSSVFLVLVALNNIVCRFSAEKQKGLTLTSGWAISGWPLQVGHFRLGHFRLSFGHFRLGPFQVGPFQVGNWPFQVEDVFSSGPFQVEVAISGWDHFRLDPFQVSKGHFRFIPLQVRAISGYNGPFQVGAISG